MNTVVWFRRDLRTEDHPALAAARKDAWRGGGAGCGVVPVFVLDPLLLARSGPNRIAFLFGCLRALIDAGVPLVVRHGDPAEVIPAIAAEFETAHVHISADASPYGRRRDDAVRDALAGAGRSLVATGSPYAVAPGSVRKLDGTPFKVFTPFSRAWRVLADTGASEGDAPTDPVPWVSPAAPTDPIPDDPPGADLGWVPPGEQAAWKRWEAFREDHLHAYDTNRNDPAADATSRLSPYLKYGCIHPLQLLRELASEPPGKGVDVFRSELCWREFYADVLWHRPDTATADYTHSLAALAYDSGSDADERFSAWAEGRTGYPIVDAGMRQLLAEGWMHNRVRMITASFLTKDLHLDWRRGARHFMCHLVDGDLASNQHGWQWTAGTGTDAAPYFRVFNPTSQGKKFDPDGAYVRRYVAELGHVTGAQAHEPGPLDAPVYPRPIVDHAAERTEALRRYSDARGAEYPPSRGPS